ncbi:phnA protein [Endozoicomonas ascidiicola]|uniref:phnA protein n=1 Tax=Endozoicomonas ascidiicola TaxID=1698521 RepID=UPI0008337295|nr:phnA protein [Endozoicomonas ascidiicola]
MAKGLQKHQARKDALNLLGKDLARRAKSKCETCEASGVSLSIYEVEPVPNEPDYDHCLMICETCKDQLENPKRINVHHWRCAAKGIWSEVPAVQVVSLRQLRNLSTTQDWAADALEHAYLDSEVEAWADSI